MGALHPQPIEQVRGNIAVVESAEGNEEIRAASSESKFQYFFIKRQCYIETIAFICREKCSYICPRTLSVARNEQFSENVARGKL